MPTSTFDVIFREPATYELVKALGVLTRETTCRLFNILPSRISDFVITGGR